MTARHGTTTARLLTAALLLLVPSACGEDAPLREWTPADHRQPPGAVGQGGPSTQAAPEALDPAEARTRAVLALFNVSCASCHGRGGRGDGPGMPPGTAAPDFTSSEFQASRTDEELEMSIRQGRGIMPPFGDQIPRQSVQALVGLVRVFGGRTPGAEGGAPAPDGAGPAEGEGAPGAEGAAAGDEPAEPTEAGAG